MVHRVPKLSFVKRVVYCDHVLTMYSFNPNFPSNRVLVRSETLSSWCVTIFFNLGLFLQ